MIAVHHEGYTVRGMTGDVSAEITDDGYVEITLRGLEPMQSFDLNGLQTFIEDLRQILMLAEQTERMNKENRELTE